MNTPTNVRPASNRMKIALIGAGGIGKEWALALKAAEISIALVVDTDPAKGEAFAQEFGGTFEPDLSAAIKSGIQAAIIAVPHVYLAPTSRQCLEAGVHVLCEKPGGITSEEVKANEIIATDKGLTYMIGFNHRYHPAYIEAKKRFDAGEIGDLMFIRARYGFGGRAGYEKEWRFDKAIAGGGELLDQGIHMIDMARWFMGEIHDVKGMAGNLFWGGAVEDNGFALLRNSGGSVAQIHVSWTNWEWVHCFEIFGTKGYLIVDGLDKRYRGPERLTIGHADPRSGKFPQEVQIVYSNESKELSLRREIDAFLNAIERKEKVPTGEDAVAALKIVETIYEQN